MKSITISILFCFLLVSSCRDSSSNGHLTPIVEEPVLNELPPATITALPTNEDRYAWQKPELVIDKLGDIEGKVIADIGSGTGYFAFRLMTRAEKVIAVDIDQDMLQLIEIFRQNLDSLQQGKIETRQATEDSPMLEEDEVDIAFIVNTIGYIADREAYLNNLRKSLRSQGQVMIVDFKMKRIPDNIAPSVDYRVSLLELENLLLETGYTNIITDDRSLEYQYIVKASRGS